MPNYNYSRAYTSSAKQYVYWIERDSIGIALHDPLKSEKNRFTSPDAVYTVTLFYHKKADHFNTLDSVSSAMTEQSELPTQFHQYLVDKAIQMGYEQKPEEMGGIGKAMYFEKKFNEGVKEAKMFTNRGRISGMRQIKQESY